jgi:hypothetical protein
VVEVVVKWMKFRSVQFVGWDQAMQKRMDQLFFTVKHLHLSRLPPLDNDHKDSIAHLVHNVCTPPTHHVPPSPGSGSTYPSRQHAEPLPEHAAHPSAREAHAGKDRLKLNGSLQMLTKEQKEEHSGM